MATEKFPTDLQEKEQSCASGHVLVGGRGAGKGPGWLWLGRGPNGVCSGGRGHQQGELYSVRSRLVPSVHVTLLIKGPVSADEMGTAAGDCFLCPPLPLMATQPWAYSPASVRRQHPSTILSSSFRNFSCSLLPSIIWLRVLGAKDSTRSLCSCDQPHHLCSSPMRLVGKGMELLVDKELSCVQKSPLRQTQLVATLPHFPVSTIPSPTTVLHLPCNRDSLRLPDICHWGFTLRLQSCSDSWIKQLLIIVYMQRYL